MDNPGAALCKGSNSDLGMMLVCHVPCKQRQDFYSVNTDYCARIIKTLSLPLPNLSTCKGQGIDKLAPQYIAFTTMSVVQSATTQLTDAASS